MGFTPQKPIKKAYEQRPEAVKAWRDDQYPAIEAKAKAEGGEIHWGDETALVNTDVRGRSYAPVGKTPLTFTFGGTRYWKPGFYYIAAGAGVSIVMAYLDYDKKIGGLGPVFNTTGDIDADMLAIKAFYAGVKGKNADQFHAD